MCDLEDRIGISRVGGCVFLGCRMFNCRLITQERENFGDTQLIGKRQFGKPKSTESLKRMTEHVLDVECGTLREGM